MSHKTLISPLVLSDQISITNQNTLCPDNITTSTGMYVHARTMYTDVHCHLEEVGNAVLVAVCQAVHTMSGASRQLYHHLQQQVPLLPRLLQ